MRESINFNRAATFYDATRKLPDDLADQITSVLLGEIRAAGAEKVLEVGIGTGRISRPLMRAGVSMVGVDISTEMMGQLTAQLTPEHTAAELLLGDATLLPLRENSFRAALVVHVFHLVKSVREVVAEISRVLEPGGVLLHQTRQPDEETNRRWHDHDAFWVEACRAHGHDLVLRPKPEQITEALTESGATFRVIELETREIPSSVEVELEDLRSRRHSWSWLIPDEIVAASMGDFEEWLRGESRPDGTFVDRVTVVVEAWQWA